MSDVSLLTLLLTVAIGAAVFALIYTQQQNQGSKKDDRSTEIAELQKTVRLLIEKGIGGGSNNNNSGSAQPYSTTVTAPPTANLPTQRNSRKAAAQFNFSSGQAAPHSNSLSPRSSPAIPSSPPSLSLQADGSSIPPMPLPTPSTSSSPALIPLNEVFALQESIKQLERRNRELNRQLTLSEVSNVVDIEKKYGLAAPGQPAEVRLTPSEVETIRAIFNLFDSDQRGSISVKEIRNLHLKLGEPMNESEADVAMKELDQDGTGEVNFHQFLYWWYESHKKGKKSTKYTERFKLVNAKLSSEHFNVDRVITQDSGTPYTLEYRLNFYYKQPNSALRQISPWHDVPLYQVGHGADGQIYNMVCEIPRYTRAKFECATGEPFNPIKQDTQHGKLRFYKHGDIMFNYGFFPQTWEDPSYVNEQTGYPGDNDPIDVLDIGAKQLRTGEIVAVKILGVLALIDDGETDWKVIAISISDAMAHMLNDIDDVETHLPGTIKAIREYFMFYKATSGMLDPKPSTEPAGAAGPGQQPDYYKSFSGKINSYALRAQAMPRQYAVDVIEDTHKHWQSLHIVNKQNVVSKGGAAETKVKAVVEGNEVDTRTEHPAKKVSEAQVEKTKEQTAPGPKKTTEEVKNPNA